jgi:hypothetical protein
LLLCCDRESAARTGDIVVVSRNKPNGDGKTTRGLGPSAIDLSRTVTTSTMYEANRKLMTGQSNFVRSLFFI